MRDSGYGKQYYTRKCIFAINLVAYIVDKCTTPSTDSIAPLGLLCSCVIVGATVLDAWTEHVARNANRACRFHDTCFCYCADCARPGPRHGGSEVHGIAQSDVDLLYKIVSRMFVSTKHVCLEWAMYGLSASAMSVLIFMAWPSGDAVNPWAFIPALFAYIMMLLGARWLRPFVFRGQYYTTCVFAPAVASGCLILGALVTHVCLFLGFLCGVQGLMYSKTAVVLTLAGAFLFVTSVAASTAAIGHYVFVNAIWYGTVAHTMHRCRVHNFCMCRCNQCTPDKLDTNFGVTSGRRRHADFYAGREIYGSP